MIQGNHHDDCLVSAECALDELDLVRTHWPFLRDRRIDADDLLKGWID